LLPSLNVPVAVNCCPDPGAMRAELGLTVIDTRVAPLTVTGAVNQCDSRRHTARESSREELGDGIVLRLVRAVTEQDQWERRVGAGDEQQGGNPVSVDLDIEHHRFDCHPVRLALPGSRAPVHRSRTVSVSKLRHDDPPVDEDQ